MLSSAESTGGGGQMMMNTVRTSFICLMWGADAGWLDGGFRLPLVRALAELDFSNFQFAAFECLSNPAVKNPRSLLSRFAWTIRKAGSPGGLTAESRWIRGTNEPPSRSLRAHRRGTSSPAHDSSQFKSHPTKKVEYGSQY